MTSTATNVQGTSPHPPQAVSDFPTEAHVILQGLLKAPDLNGKKGVVRSALSTAGRYSVYINELDKCVGIKPSNMRYEPIYLDSLSVKELKIILKYKNQQPANLSGMDKSDLQARVSNLISSSEELPELLAKANDNKFISTIASEQVSNVSPAQLRQQARMMKTMDPSTIRRMDPKLANMTDSQIKMAADQMEMMANNPSLMKTAVQQMKNMDPAQLQMLQGKMSGADSYTNNSVFTHNDSSTATANTADVPTSSIYQAQQTAKKFQNMNPDELRHQAQMLKTMDPDILRRTNPQLAQMSDSQIKMMANQFEMMASNPAMMKMVKDQMKNATPEQLEAMTKGQIPKRGGFGSSSKPTGIPSFDIAQIGGDPTEMLANMNTDQLKGILNTVKDNPEMIKTLAGMTGISEDKLKQGVDSFAGMDDVKIDAALKMLTVVQKMKKIWTQVDAKAGGHLKIILVMMVVSVIVWIVWYFFLAAQSGSTVDSAHFREDQYYATGADLESEF